MYLAIFTHFFVIFSQFFCASHKSERTSVFYSIPGPKALFFSSSRSFPGPRSNSRTFPGLLSVGTTLANSVKSDPGCTSKVYFDNMTLTSQKPCIHNNKFDYSETNGYFHNKRCRNKHDINEVKFSFNKISL